MERNMSEHLSGEMLETYRRRSLSTAELLEAHDHIDVCNICRRRLFNVEQVTAEASNLRITINDLADLVPEHPDFEVLAAYVDDRLDATDREILRSHIELCHGCAEELRDLLGFKAAVANATEQPAVTKTADSTTTKLLASWRLFQQWSQPQLAGTFAVSFVLVAMVMWIALRSDSSHETEIVKSGPTAPAAEIADSQVLSAPGQVDSTKKEITVALNDGVGKVAIDKGGRITGLEALPAIYRETVRTVLTNQAAQPSRAVADLVGKSEVLMGTEETSLSFSLNTPVGAVVSTNRPLFRWEYLRGATSYTVQIFDSDFRKVVTSPSLSTPEWRIENSLESGKIYSWQVIAVSGEGAEITSPTAPAPEAKFKVLEQAKVNNLRRVRQDYGRCHLTMGVLYSREGLLEDAEREFRALLREKPRSSLARKLLREVLTARGKR
jgi:hypothetical protein